MHRHTRRHRGVLLAIAAILALGLAACGDDDIETAGTDTESSTEEKGADTIQIEYVDYAYSVSGPLVAGGTIEFRNSGKELHMMGLGKLKAGKTLEDVTDLLAKQDEGQGGGEEGGEDNPAIEETTTSAPGGEEGGGEEGGGEDPFAALMDQIGLPANAMSPGQSAAVTVPDLAPGTYAMMCFLPQEGTGKSHFSLGMVNQLKVVAGAPKTPSADTTYKVAAGKTPEGPATLTAGKHTIKIEATDAKDLEPGFGKVDAGTTFDQLDKKIDATFETDSPPPKGAAASLPGDIVWAGHDFGDVTTFYVTIDFAPGTYFLVASDSDIEDAPSPPKELLEIKVT